MKSINDRKFFIPFVLLYLLLIQSVFANVHYQGRITNNDGTTLTAGDYFFKFAIKTGNDVLWSNDGSTGTIPSSGVSVYVNENGLYSILLGGDQMEPINPDIFSNNPETYLHIWFDGTDNPMSELTPAMVIAPVPYAIHSADDEDTNPSNELQVLSISNNELSISDGNSVTLPEGGEVEVSGTIDVDWVNVGGETNGGVLVYNDNYVERANIGITESGVGGLSLKNTGNSYNIIASHISGETDAGAIGIFRDGSIGAILTQDLTNMGQLALYDVDGYLRGYMGSGTDPNTGESTNAAIFGSYNTVGNRVNRLSMLTSDDDNGAMVVYDADFNSPAVFMSAQNYPGDAKDGAGVIWLDDGQGNWPIWLDAYDGSINGTTKNFRVPHPLNSSKEIVYTSLEGPEAAMYIRGKIQLTNGAGNVEFPEHFTLLANMETATVQLTPHSKSSKGLAVTKLSGGIMIIEELWDSKGNYEVSYFVQAVRAGFEDNLVVRDKKIRDHETVGDPTPSQIGIPVKPGE
jgi:hypothetical protein